MAVEIERKFLVASDSWKAQVESESSLKQGYLSAEEALSVRVRIAKGKGQLTIKGGTSGISRSEYEYDIPLDDAQEMIANLVSGSVIDKTRYKVRCGDHLWDLDVFHGDNQGLVMAEVELASESEAFLMPDWAGQEVSDDPRYYNANLITHPFCDW
jgi:adenylate cyclase